VLCAGIEPAFSNLKAWRPSPAGSRPWEETVGFEPTRLLHPPVFGTGALIRSCHVSMYFEERAGFEPARVARPLCLSRAVL
jgi:hypothetical protein